ncbi:hypothetical protein BJ684DRAFT_19744 [Piptocephalis cylindrospora]|uniref:Uncharacterized protein n=1 Tax=Piptocephalis cylindrospora TaxID=1907219 RepID=A0A4P9Y496_9FUNG|nr:hypothetical protein BJ684DRAFT_19744 [Piptocephalis cylindrospora]|eukprot:RKP13798.1 hypothetical protein BJ684DRAFT_19744 [Piptocephalis cylindrospora]
MSLKDQIDDPRPDPYVPVVNNDDETWDGPYHIIKEGITTSHTILKKLSNAIFPQSRLDTHAKTQTIKDGVSLIDRLIPTLTSQSNGLENLCRFLKSKPHSRHMHLVDDLFRIDVSELVSATIQHLSYIPSEHKDEDGLKTRMNANGALDYEKLTLLLRSLRSEISQTVNPSEVEVPHQLLQTNVLASLTLVTRATLRLLVIQQVLTVITAVEKLVDLQADGAKWLGD